MFSGPVLNHEDSDLCGERILGVEQSKFWCDHKGAGIAGSSVPVRFGRRERPEFERRPTTFKGWIWCTSRGGRSAWVPESWVVIEGNCCTLSREYDPAELDLKAGEKVVVEVTERGWGRVHDDAGRAGWVPLECLTPISE